MHNHSVVGDRNTAFLCSTVGQLFSSCVRLYWVIGWSEEVCVCVCVCVLENYSCNLCWTCDTKVSVLHWDLLTKRLAAKTSAPQAALQQNRVGDCSLTRTFDVTPVKHFDVWRPSSANFSRGSCNNGRTIPMLITSGWRQHTHANETSSNDSNEDLSSLPCCHAAVPHPHLLIGHTHTGQEGVAMYLYTCSCICVIKIDHRGIVLGVYDNLSFRWLYARLSACMQKPPLCTHIVTFRMTWTMWRLYPSGDGARIYRDNKRDTLEFVDLFGTLLQRTCLIFSISQNIYKKRYFCWLTVNNPVLF